MIWTKLNHRSTKFQTFDCSREISPNLFFDRLLFLKVYNISAKEKYREVMSHDTTEWCKIWRKTDLLFQSWQKFSEFWFEHLKFSKFLLSLVPFEQNSWHGTEEWKKCKEKLNCEKWHEKYGTFSPEHLKISKWDFDGNF